MAKDFAQAFVHHPVFALGSNAIPELPFDCTERAFDVASLVVVLHVLFGFELEVVKRLLEMASYRPGCIALERDVGLPTTIRNLLKVLERNIRFVRRYLTDGEIPLRLFHEWHELRGVCRVLVENADGGNDVGFRPASQMHFHPSVFEACGAVLVVEEPFKLVRGEPRGINRKSGFNAPKWPG
jgi:hypothetical protein